MATPEVAKDPGSSQKLLQMLSGAWTAQAISVAAALGIADLLKDGAKNSDQLAKATSTHADSLYRLLRALTSIGIFAEAADGKFSLTPLAECLRSDAPDSMRNAARMTGLPVFWRSWQELLHSVKTGETGLQQAWGVTNPFSHFSDHPEEGAIFDGAMNEFSRTIGASVAEAYNFGKFGKIVDAGGGHGALLISILRRYPGTRGIVFDLPQVVKGAHTAIAAAGLADRCKDVAGDFLESVPASADAYLMKSIIHGFEDERAQVILENIRRAIRPDGRLLLVDHVIPPAEVASPGKLSDLMMLVMSGGRERTRKEFEDLLGRAGFKLLNVYPTTAPQSIVEGAPA